MDNNEVKKERNKNSIPSQTFNTILGEKYFELESKLNTLKEESKNYFNSISIEYPNKIQKLVEEFNLYFSKVVEKIQNSFELQNQATGEEIIDENNLNIIRNYTKYYLDNFNSILVMNEQIYENIQQNIKTLLNFVDISSKNLDKENPTHTFLNKEFLSIINNSMFSKISMENYDFIKAINTPDINEKAKDLIFKISENKTFSVNVNKDDKLQKSVYLNNLRRCYKYLSSLKIKDIQELENFCQDNFIYPKMKNLVIENSEFKELKSFVMFQNLEKLIINKCFKINIKMFDHLDFNNIKELYFVNNGFLNSDFDTIITDYLLKNDSLKKNLTILSFKNNNLSKIDLNQAFFSSKHTFHSLRELDLRKNKIYKFSMNPQYFPSLKIIDVCYNSFTSSNFNNYKDYLVLLSGNIFLMDDALCKDYYSELERKLTMPLPPFNSLCLSFIPKALSYNYMSKLKISNSLLINLTYLDLSFDHMNCDTFFSFIKNNKRCLNIKRLNLKGNELDDTFFEKYLDNKYNELFSNLEYLNLNNNLIGGTADVNYKDDEPIQEQFQKYEKFVYKLRLIYNFIKANKNLKLFSIIKNPISKIIKTVNITEENKNEHEQIFKENNKIVINCFYSFLLKIKKELICDNNEEIGRKELDIRFDCKLTINQYLRDFNFEKQLILFDVE